MQLIPHQQFGRLRLRPYCPDDATYSEGIDEHGQFITEQIRGAVFARWRKKPDELVMAEITLNDCSTSVGPTFFSAIGLNLEPELSSSSTKLRFNTPPQWQRNDGGFIIFQTNGASTYEVSCGFTNDLLCQVSVRRLDIELPDEG